MRPDGPQDPTLDLLLALNGEIFSMDNGYWAKFDAWRIEPNPDAPHGIRYSLTLHDRDDRRILGFDNAHALKPHGRRFRAHKTTWDHRHRQDKITPYEFESPAQLLEDFWREANRIMAERR